MSRTVWLVVAAWLATTAGAAGQKNPYRNYNEQKFVDNMQAGGRNYVAVNEYIARGDYATAKAQLTRAREQFAVTVQFWRDVHQKDAAVTMLRTVLSRLDDLDKTLSAEPVDATAAKASLGRINEGCQACHAVFREQVAGSKSYRVNQAALR